MQLCLSANYVLEGENLEAIVGRDLEVVNYILLDLV